MSRIQSRRQRKSETEKRLKQRSQPHTKPLSALQRGNTDPFSAAGITITPQINQVLTFARDVCLPAFYFLDALRDPSTSANLNRDVANSSGWISSPAAQLGWQQVVDALSDKCTALACLSTYLALMSICNINSAKATEASLKMRAGSSALLRQRLLRFEPQKAVVETHRELLWQVFWHFYAEFFAGNMIAAQVHGKMLRQSCETAGEGVITDHFLDSVIFVDSHMAAKYLTRPVLDIDIWIPDVFASAWKKIDDHIAEITGESGERLHASVEPQSLRTIFTRTRQALILLQRPEEAQSFEIDFESIYYWLNSHSYVDTGILIDKYLKLVEQASTLPSEHDRSDQASGSLGTMHTLTALCLSALFAIRDIGQEVRINGIDVVDASTTITKHLKEALKQARVHCTPEERVKYRSAHLWCAFMGALGEQRQALPKVPEPLPPKPEQKKKSHTPIPRPMTVEPPAVQRSIPPTLLDPSNMHFNHMLAEIAHSMSLLSWQQVSDMLKQFIYTDLSEPHGGRWFWKTMGAYLDRGRQAAREEQERRRATMADITTAREQSTAFAGAPPIQVPVGEIRRRPGRTESGRSTPTGQWSAPRQRVADQGAWDMTKTHSQGDPSGPQRGQQRQRGYG